MHKLKIKEVIEQWIMLYQDLQSIKRSLNVKQEALQDSTPPYIIPGIEMEIFQVIKTFNEDSAIFGSSVIQRFI